jgi:hypothetical protein
MTTLAVLIVVTGAAVVLLIAVELLDGWMTDRSRRRREARITRVERRMLDLAEASRADVEKRRVDAINGIGDDLENVYRLPEREPAQVIDIRGGGGWRR